MLAGLQDQTGSMCYMPYEDEELLEAARRISEEYGVELVVVNVSSIRGRIKALLSGVRKAPAVKIGDRLLDGPRMRPSSGKRSRRSSEGEGRPEIAIPGQEP